MTIPRAFDRAAALANLGDDEALLRQVAAIFIDEWPRAVASLHAAAAAGDARALHAAAHRLKGSLANFAAGSAVAAARELEAACADGLPAQHAALLEELLRRGEELAAELRRETGA